MQAFRIKTLINVVSHIGHVAVTVLAEPLSVAVVIVTKIDVGDSQLRKAKLMTPRSDGFGELLVIRC